MKTVRDVLKAKGGVVFAAEPDDTVYSALTTMAEYDVGCLIVCSDGQLVGIFSERDYARQVILKGKASKDTPIRDVMTARVVFVRPEQNIEECMALMTDKHIRHLPVLDGDTLIGLVSIGDVVKAVISEKEFLIAQLEHYISGG